MEVMKKFLNCIKKVLKGFGIFFLSFGIIEYTIMFFTEDPSLRFTFVLMDILFGFFLYLLLRKRKKEPQKAKKTEAVTSPTIEWPQEINESAFHVTSNLDQEPAIKSMKGSYTIIQAKEHIRILKDCLNIFEKTKNLETFFTRYEYAMQIAMTLDQAAKAGAIPKTTDFPVTLMKAADSQKLRILHDSFFDHMDKISKLKTNNAKLTHWNRYLELLGQYEDQYNFDLTLESEYCSIQNQVNAEIQKLRNDNTQ